MADFRRDYFGIVVVGCPCEETSHRLAPRCALHNTNAPEKIRVYFSRSSVSLHPALAGTQPRPFGRGVRCYAVIL